VSSLAFTLLLLAQSGPPPVAAAVAEGDAHYARRAEGAQAGVARPEPVETALDAYRRALAAQPDFLEARWKLLRALFFRASFSGAAAAERKRLFEEAKRVADEGIATLEKRTASAKGPARTAALKKIDGASRIYFWAAVVWGEWALGKGKLAAAWEGAGGRIRDLAKTVVDIDPELEAGGGDRILGRLHDQSPKVPLVTGWISRDAALRHLRASLVRDPDNTVSQLFLAEAILNHDPARKDEARALLVRCANAVPRPEYLVEDAHYSALARKRLAELR
jgi:hypothetical protein